MQDVFTTEELVRKAKKLTPELEMLKSLLKICDELITQERFWEAIEVAHPYDAVANRVIHAVSIALVNNRRPLEGVKAAGLLPAGEPRDETFSAISNRLTRREPFEKSVVKYSVAVALKIQNLQSQSQALKHAALMFDKNDCLSRADKTVRLIPLDAVREEAMQEIRNNQATSTDNGCLAS